MYQGDRIISEDGVWPTIPSQGANNGGGAGAGRHQRRRVAHTLRGEGFDASEDGTGRGTPLAINWQSGGHVRRLTPRECERLQGMPDDHTRIPWRGKPAEKCPDGPRYRAIGNSMAVPVMRWIGERIAMMEAVA